MKDQFTCNITLTQFFEHIAESIEFLSLFSITVFYSRLKATQKTRCVPKNNHKLIKLQSSFQETFRQFVICVGISIPLST